LFDNFEYLDNTKASESGLHILEEKSFETRLYRVFGKQTLRLCLTELQPGSFKTENVYLLDVGLEIFQWNGSRSSLQHKSKCRIACERIKKCDRQAKAVYYELAEGDTHQRFSEVIGIITESHVIDNQYNDIFETIAESTNILYQVLSLENEELKIISSGILHKTDLDTNSCYIIDAGVEFFLWIGNNADNTLKNAHANQLLSVIIMNFNVRE
jgi:hypothetical protein